MTRQEAINWCVSKIGQYLDFDKQFNTQCVDFFNYYYQFLTGLNPYGQGLGVDYAYQLASKRPAGLTWVKNNPADKNQLPSDGDIIIMSGANGFGGGAGHVLASKNTDANAVRGIDETPNTKVAARQYSWDNVLGWFVPDQFMQSNTPQGGNEDMIKAEDRDLLHKLTVKLKLWGEPVDMDKEMKAWAGQDWRRFLSEGMNEAIDRYGKLQSAAQEATNLAETNRTLTTANGKLASDLDQLKLSSTLQIKSLQEQLAEATGKPVYIENPETGKKLDAIKVSTDSILSFVKSIWGSVTSLHKKIK